MKRGHCTAALGCALLLLSILSRCAAGSPKGVYRAHYGVPLYVSPFGVASCSNRTVLEARVWDLPAERFLGSFTVTAEGEYTVVAYMLHMVVSPDTQKDAMEKLARQIVTRLAGLTPLESKNE